MTQQGRRVVVFGEVLCDLFSPTAGQPLKDAPIFVPHLGGAPANVAVQLARLGATVSIITAVGADPLGERLRAGLEHEGVDVSALQVRSDRRTGATLVEVDDDGERRFFGFREQCADLAISVADIDRPLVQGLLADAAIVHSGTVSLVSDNSRAATIHLQDAGRRRGALLSLDVNLRPGMYPSNAMLIERALAAVERADVVKATVDEVALLSSLPSTSTPREFADALLSRGPRLVWLTDGERPLHLATLSTLVTLEPVHVRTVDATGAGDAFMGACLATLLELNPRREALGDLDKSALTRIGDAGRRAGAAAVGAIGATTAMLRKRPT